MREVSIWYLTDNESGASIARGIGELGLQVRTITDGDFAKANIIADIINLFVIDLKGTDLESVIDIIKRDARINGFLKFVVLGKRQAKKVHQVAVNLLHVEYLTRPLGLREFTLLLEKTIVVEKYREIMKLISRDAQERIETYESLVGIGRRDAFDVSAHREVFERIIENERQLMAEQKKLNETLREVSLLRQAEMFDVRNRVKADEMLSELRRHELMDAKNIIRAQEAVIDYSSQELKDAERFIDASTRVQELSRAEAIRLQEELASARRENERLSGEVKRLTRELKRAARG
ncbi:MAG TPA: hypothetical protein PKM65_18900 [Spirochaetota bacterium]|nr:hypothetical protein [Spirochaetota bacterium]HNT11421.1 hypothetical protein [Spirochaetota bacterium]HNV45726.1 hypothetical protein [Spirochaetota bacterium]HOS38518.1 hypothetical protein [Spirochaetota bacterium]HPI22569.1 hypothetical protein [Spirochaetota bacterium]